MKIVFLSDDFPPTSFGGAGISTSELALGMKKAGHDVSVITTVRHTSEAGESDYQGLAVFKIASDYDGRWRAWRSLYNPPVVRRVRELLREIRPDVVHANNIHFHLSYYCLKVAKRYAKAVVWTARDAMAFSYGKLATPNYLEHLDARLTWRDHLRQAGRRYNPFRNMLIRRYLRSLDARFAVSRALRDALARNGIIGVVVTHTGISVREWEADPARVEEFRKRYSLQGKKVVLFGGRLGAGEQAIRAFALLIRQMPDAVLLVMGKNEDAGRMKKAGEDLPIVFTGWISGEEKITACGASDVVWVPSTYFDAFPRSALEAQAAGKPVIATRLGGAPELVLDGKTGYVVNPTNPQEIADKTLELLRNTGKTAAFGRAGQERIKTQFDINDMIDQLISYYREFVA